MKQIMKQKQYLINYLSLVTLILLTACEYKEIADSDYPDSKLYLPAAVTGIYKIESLTKENPTTPTPGSTYRYVLNTAKNTFDVPLAVFRSGLNRDQTFNIRLTANADTVQSLIDAGTLDETETTIIPSNAYTMEETVVMTGGNSVSPFTLSLDLEYIKARVEEDRKKKEADRKLAEEDRKKIEEDKKREEEAKIINPDTVYVPTYVSTYVSTYFSMKYATGVTISTGNPGVVNPDLNTVIVCLDIRIFSPEVSFEAVVDGSNPKLVSFLNRSEFGVAYQWAFGDGKTSSEENPKHTYESDGDYLVTLKTTGLLKDEVSYAETVTITSNP
jgi:hypothetical protein